MTVTPLKMRASVSTTHEMPSVTVLAHVFILLALAAPQKSAAPAPDDLFAEIFQRGLVKQKSMKSIRATFTETTTSSLLVKPIVGKGTIVAAPPARVRMMYVEPEPKTIVMDGRTLTVAWPKRNEREQIDIRQTQKRIDQYFTNASLDDLRKLFDIAAQPDAALRRVDRVEMIPKRKQIKQGLEKLEIWIDRETAMMVQMRLSFPGGDQKTIALTDLAVDIPLADDAFRP
jgi:outer membrane lipoprotein-sorting protein